jgi:dienelactone hydrolase
MPELTESRAPSEPPSNPPRRRARIGWWVARATLALLLLLGIYLAIFPAGRGTMRAAKLLPELMSLGNLPSGEGVHHSEQMIDVGESMAYVNLYEPLAPPPIIPGSRGAMIIIAGVGDNRDNAQLINLESSIARSGVVVLSLITPALINYNLSPDDSSAVVAAFQFLEHRPEVNSRAIGMVGISAGGGLVSLGAADARIRDRVAYIALFGSYFDTAQLMANIGHRALQDAHGSYTKPWHPQDVPLYVLASTVADLLPAKDGKLIVEAFRDHTAIPPQTLASFSPAGVAIYHLLRGDEPDRVDANIAQLTPAMHARLDALSPQNSASNIHAHIYLLHDRQDEFVPYTESVNFGNWLDAHHRDYHLVLFDIFQHVEVQTGLPFTTLALDSVRLFGVLASIMTYGA